MSFNEWLQICSNNNIQTYEQYIDKFSSDDNMPLMPQEPIMIILQITPLMPLMALMPLCRFCLSCI